MRAAMIILLLLPATSLASPLFSGTPGQAPAEPLEQPSDPEQTPSYSSQPSTAGADNEQAQPNSLTSRQQEEGQSQLNNTSYRPKDLSLTQQLMTWIIVQQRALHRQLAEGIEQLRDAPSTAGAAALILTSFLYGVFHAAGPGHGKAVITTYLLTHRQHLRRGILLSFAAAMLQGVTAIIAVSIVLFGAGRAAREAVGQTGMLEQISFGLITLVGLWLSARAIRSLWHLLSASSAPDPQPCGAAAEHHVAGARPPHAGNLSTMAATVLAVGARPCSGAILVLVVGKLMGIWTAGVGAVLAMSLGTGLTVATLATLAVLARHWVSGYTRDGSPRLAAMAQGVALAGGLFILTIGLILLTGSFTIPTSQHPLGLPG